MDLDLSLVKDLSQILSKKQIKKLFGIKYEQVIDIFGDFHAFLKVQNTENTSFNNLVHLFKILRKDDIDKQIYVFFICGKIGYLRYTYEYLMYVFNYLRYRRDLNIFTRLYVGIIKGTYKVRRLKYGIRFESYMKHKVKRDLEIEGLFADKVIDRLYIYKVKREIAEKERRES